MHISEGVLSAPVLITGTGLGLAGVAVGLKKMDYERLPLVAVFSAVFFVASLVRMPLGPTSVHLLLPGVCGLVLGWSAFPAILVGLTLQALLFQHGGLTVLGTNTFIMAAPAVLLGLLCGKALRNDQRLIRAVFEFICGAGAVLLSGCLVALALMATDRAFSANAYLVILTHTVVMLVEGALTILIVEFVRRVRPEMLPAYSRSRD
ncbi:cobalt transporter CbiM [Thermodesulfobacteriota bacterium]